MDNISEKQFNEIFLSQLQRFDTKKYAIESFYNSDGYRFQEISRIWARKYGTSSQNYMASNFSSWKEGYVRPNSKSTSRIINTSLSTFTQEEKFLEAYNSIAKFIRRTYPESVKIKEIPEVCKNIISKLDSFTLEKNSYYSKEIFAEKEIEIYESTVVGIFKLYLNIIFTNLENDLGLVSLIIKKADTKFLKVSFVTYLYGIQINTDSIITDKYKNPFREKRIADFNSVWKKELSELSLNKVAEIRRANDVTKIDGMLSKNEIDKFIERKNKLISSNNGGEITLRLKTNAGIINIHVRILSSIEKVIIVFRAILTIIILILITVYLTISFEYLWYLIFTGIITLLFLPPSFDDIKKLTIDIKNKYYG